MLYLLRLKSYGCKMKVFTAVNILGLVWIIFSVLNINVGILATANIPFFSKNTEDVYVKLVIMIMIILIILVMNIFLLKRNRSGRFDGVKRILRYICNTFLSLQIIFVLIFLPYLLFLIIERPLHDKILTFIMGLVWLIFLSLGAHGVENNRKSHTNAYIIFNIVMMVVQIILQVLYFLIRGYFGNLVGLIVVVGFFLLHIGYFMVLYSIIDVSPEDDQDQGKLRLQCDVNILGWMGIICSNLFIISSGILVAVNLFLFKPTEKVYIIAGVIMIINFLVMLVMNIFLIDRNRAGSFDGVQSILRICKLILSLLIIGNLVNLCYLLALIITKFALLLNGPVNPEVFILIVFFIMNLVWLIFFSLGINGVRKNRKRLISVYITFIIMMMVVQIILEILSYLADQRNNSGDLVGLIFGVVFSMFFFILHIGYFVVLNTFIKKENY